MKAAIDNNFYLGVSFYRTFPSLQFTKVVQCTRLPVLLGLRNAKYTASPPITFSGEAASTTRTHDNQLGLGWDEMKAAFRCECRLRLVPSRLKITCDIRSEVRVEWFVFVWILVKLLFFSCIIGSTYSSIAVTAAVVVSASTPFPVGLSGTGRYFSLYQLESHIKGHSSASPSLYSNSSHSHFSALSYPKAQQGMVNMVANVTDPGYALELSTPVPSVGLPKATIRFPVGEVSLHEKEEEEVKSLLSDDTNTFTAFKCFIFAFKHRFGPSGKLRTRDEIFTNIKDVAFESCFDT
ncbi:hypothetical protein VNO77_06104 [Canavalia gladiata]|uniref:Uncharacterized protein n=1 Tax=Canavalia gladiata TaxID=3824 RepID=A0AAN9N587_CANGL